MSIDVDTKALKLFGNKLKDVREQHELTQEDVAKGIGITPNYYARIERGEENPTFSVIESICKALKVKSSQVLPF